MRIGVAFVFNFVVTMITIIPTAFGVGFDVMVQISNALKLLVTALLWAEQFIVNMNEHVLIQSAFKWEAFATEFAIELQVTMSVAMFVKLRLCAEIFVTLSTFNYTMIIFVVAVKLLNTTKYFITHFGLFEPVSLGLLEPSISMELVCSWFLHKTRLKSLVLHLFPQVM